MLDDEVLDVAELVEEIDEADVVEELELLTLDELVVLS